MLNLINNATIVNEGRQFQGAVVVDGEYIIDVLEQPLTSEEVLETAMAVAKRFSVYLKNIIERIGEVSL